MVYQKCTILLLFAEALLLADHQGIGGVFRMSQHLPPGLGPS